MDNQLFLDMIHLAIICSIISSQIIQKIKKVINNHRSFNMIISCLISFVIGFSYTLSFYSSNKLYAIWIGIFTLIGAEGMYRAFKGSFGLESSNK